MIRMVEAGLLGIGEKNGVRFVGEDLLENWQEAIEVASREKGWGQGGRVQNAWLRGGRMSGFGLCKPDKG